MSDLRTAAQQALKVLEAGFDVSPILAGEAEEALRAALAQQAELSEGLGPLPPTTYVLARESDGYSPERLLSEAGYTEEHMRAYAAAAVALERDSRQAEPVEPHRWEGDNNIESPFNACMHKTYCMTLKQAEPLNLADPAVRKRLATQWGYVPAAQAEPVEPVAWECRAGGLKPLTQRQYDAQTVATKRHYTRIAPPRRTMVPLTEEEILAAVGWERAAMYMKLAPNFPVDEAKKETLTNARAVEKASWEKNHG